MNIQSGKSGPAKAYQVRQVLQAIDKLAKGNTETEDEADEQA